MRFDDYWNDDDGRGDVEKALAADGRHTGEIVDAKIKRLEFMKSDANRDGASIVVTVSLPNAQPVESIIPVNYRGRIEAVARAAGVSLPARGQDWDESQLIGRTVTVETLQAVAKSGKQYVRVEKWLPSPSQPLPAERKPVARSQAAKAHQAFTSNASAADDIPF